MVRTTPKRASRSALSSLGKLLRAQVAAPKSKVRHRCCNLCRTAQRNEDWPVIRQCFAQDPRHFHRLKQSHNHSVTDSTFLLHKSVRPLECTDNRKHELLLESTCRAPGMAHLAQHCKDSSLSHDAPADCLAHDAVILCQDITMRAPKRVIDC